MGAYEIIVTVIFFTLSVLFVSRGVKAFAQAAKANDKTPRKNFRRKALFLMELALMFLLCAIYILFRISWMMLVVMILGYSAVGYVIGSGVGANMREH